MLRDGFRFSDCGLSAVPPPQIVSDEFKDEARRIRQAAPALRLRLAATPCSYALQLRLREVPGNPFRMIVGLEHACSIALPRIRYMHEMDAGNQMKCMAARECCTG